MLLFYSKQLLQYEKEKPFFWNWYREQKESKNGLMWWEEYEEYRNENVNKVISDKNDMVEYQKKQQNALKEKNQNNVLRNIEYVGKNQNVKNHFFDSKTVSEEIKESNVFSKEQKQYQKQYEYEKQYQVQKQIQQQYDIEKQYHVEQQKQYDVEKQNRYEMQQKQKKEKQKEYEQIKQKEKQKRKQKEQKKDSERQHQSVWQKEKDNEKYYNDVEEQQYSIVKEQAVKGENFYKKQKEKSIDIREVKNNDFWEYGTILNNEIESRGKTSVFWLGESALQREEHNNDYVYYNSKKRKQQKQIKSNEIENNFTNHFTIEEKREKKENNFDNYYNNSKYVKSVWQKYKENEIEQKSQKIDVEMIQNIVKNSLEQKEEQKRKGEKIQSEPQSINIDTIFLDMTEKLLEQRERSLKRNTLKV